jgi:5'-nucleotidase
VLPLVVGVSTRALFDCEDEHRVFAQDGESAYCALQREREANPFRPGCAFQLIKRLLALNSAGNPKLVEVVLLSRSKPDQALRIFRSCEEHGLAVFAGSFTGGRPVAPYARAWGVDLFLSKDDEDVRSVLAVGIAAARLAPAPLAPTPTNPDEIHFALDGDAVTFGSESEVLYCKAGLSAFERHERVNAQQPLAPGPFGGVLLRKLLALRSLTKGANGANQVRLSMVTAREAPAHERAIRTLRHWGAIFDEIHFVGHRTKAPFLAAAGALIFFDDSEARVEAASRLVMAGHVPEVGIGLHVNLTELERRSSNFVELSR